MSVRGLLNELGHSFRSLVEVMQKFFSTLRIWGEKRTKKKREMVFFMAF